MRLFIFSLLLLSSFSTLFATDMYLAPFNIYRDSETAVITDIDRSFNRLLSSRLGKEDFGGRLVIKSLAEIKKYETAVPKSTLDASEICEQAGIEYLVYGSLKKTDTYYDVELKIFDKEKNEIRKTIFEKEGLDEIDVVVETLAQKTSLYLKQLLGLPTDYKRLRNDYSGIMIQTSAGYWIPYFDWFNIINTLFVIDAGILIVPSFKLEGTYTSFFRFGLDLSYSMALSKTGHEESYLHPFCLKLPIEFFYEFVPQHIVKIGITPKWEMDLLIQKPIYNDPIVTLINAFGISIPISYEYWFDKNIAIGLVIDSDISFQNPVLIENQFELTMLFKISSFEGANQ